MSISRKLTFMLIAACTVPLVLISAAVIGFEAREERRSLAKQLSLMASVTGWNSSAAITFHDTRDAQKILASLKAVPHILTACLHDDEGILIAEYRLPASPVPCPRQPSTDGTVYTSDSVLLTRPILFDGERIGTVSIRSDLNELEDRIHDYLLLLSVLLVAGIGATALLSTRLQRIISDPIRSLAHVASLVSARKDYSLRAPKAGNDELGLLVDAFNEMLARIGQHAAELSRMNHDLEAARQTAELSSAALAVSESRFHSTFDEGPVGMAILDRDLRILEANRALQDMLGYTREEMRAMASSELTHPEDRASSTVPFRDLIAGKVTRYQIEERYLTRRGKVVWGRLTVARFLGERGEPLAFSMVEDISERKHLEEQFRQAQKMEAIGRLAGGVAHDFNNLLTVIKGNTELLARRLTTQSPMQRNLAQVQRAADRAAALVDQLLAFSRKQFLAPRVLDLRPALRDMERMLRPLIGEDIELVLELGFGPAHVNCDPVQLEQILLNLAVNARDAMPSGGRLTIRTDLRRFHCRPAQDGASASGDYVALSVADTGTGMTESVRAHIFEPFFTTKEVGKGTGLGLSTVYGVVQQAGGFIDVESTPGEGSTFTVCLPLAQPLPAPLPGESEGAALPSRDGRETVLVVEDEELVRAILCETLAECGYTVIEAHNPEHALDLIETCSKPLDLLLTDIVMPRMNGCELTERLRRRFPTIKVLCISGYTNQVLPQGAHFLKKPFTPEDLIREVTAVLDGTADTPFRTPAPPVPA